MPAAVGCPSGTSHPSFARFDSNDLTVAHVQDAVGDLGGFGIMSDHQNCLVEFPAGFAQHSEDGVRVLCIEVAGRLICKDDGGAGNERPGDGDTLLLAAGKLVGPVVQTALDAQKVRQMVHQCGIERLAIVGNLVSKADVGVRGNRWQKIETLKHEADVGAAKLGAFGVGKLGEFDVLDAEGSGGRGSEAPEHVKKCRFAGARGTDDSDEFARIYRERDFAESGNFKLAGAIGFAEVTGFDNGLHWALVSLPERNGAERQQRLRRALTSVFLA